MEKNVYIENIIYIENDKSFAPITGNIDKIGNMCIIGIEKLLNDNIINRDVPIFFGSAYSSLNSLHEFNKVYETKGPLSVNPSLFPNTVLNSPSCRASIYHKITSPIYNISNGIYSGIDSLELAYFNIFHGNLESAIVCVAEERSEFASNIEDNLVDACGAAYLTVNRTKFELSAIIENYKNKNVFNKYIKQSTDIIKSIMKDINIEI